MAWQAAVDWSRSPLGLPGGWPVPLLTLARLVMDADEPAFVAWGEDLCVVYNDGFAELLGERHPEALGQPLHLAWPAGWKDAGALVDRCLVGEGVRIEGGWRPDGDDGGAEGWYRGTMTPVRDESGAIRGVHCMLLEASVDAPANAGRSGTLRKLEQLFQRAPGFMAVTVGPDHVVEFANEACMHLVGRRDLTGKSVQEAIPELADQVYLDLFDRVYATGEAFVGERMEVRFQPPGEASATRRYVDFVFQPITDADGGVTGVFVQGTDVTAHEQAQEQLHRSEVAALSLAVEAEIHARRLDALLEAAPVGIIYADVEGRFQVVNAAVRRTWGEHPLSADDAAPPRWKAWWADGSERHGQPLALGDWPLARALAGEESPHAIVEIEPFDPTGSRKVLELRAKPVRTQEGAIVGAVVAEVDITAEVETRTRLQESEAKFRTITDAVPQIVWSTLPDGRHDYFNQRWYDFTGLPHGHSDDADWDALLHPDDKARAWEAWSHSLATGEPYSSEYRLRHRSGEFRWVLDRALPVRDGRGDIVRWMGTCTDIHGQVAAQEALEDASRRKDEFLAMLAHELRNPLAPITTAASVLPLASRDPERVAHLGEVIKRQAHHMTRMVDDLLDVSRVTRGVARLNREPVDLKAVAANALEQARPLIEERGHQLVVSMVDEPLPVHGDAVRLAQVISNLLSNAAKYTRRGGRIDVELAARGNLVVAEVRDNGSGIEPELLPRVFDLFTQGPRRPDRRQGGLGIGLALAKSLVDLHGGRIIAHSDGRGCGSRFTITLPRARSEPSVQRAGRDRDSGAAIRTRRVIVVDDNVDAARTTAFLLQLGGHDVRICHDAAAALRLSAEEPAEVYVLDIGLPDMSGHELARLLRAEPGTARALLVAVTGYGRPEDRAESRGAGFDVHLVKPVDADRLLQAIAPAGQP